MMTAASTPAAPTISAADPEPGPVAAEMIRRLATALSPTRLALEDQSAHHIGHVGHDARGESHFALTIVAAAFTGQSRLARQRLVHQALGDLLHDRVHALSITARAPDEV